MLDDGPRNVSRKDFIRFVKAKYSKVEANIVFEVIFEKGVNCKIDGLIKKVELNGKLGKCTGKYETNRIGIEVDGR